jgi:hypothetical protein
MSLRPLMVAGAVALVGCGGDSASREPLIGPPPPCPAGTAEVGVRDVLPELPPGLALYAGRKKQFSPLVKAIGDPLGDKLRSIRTGVVAEDGRRFGIGVLVINTKTQNVDPEPDTTGRRQPITVAGDEGLIQVRTEGARVSGNVGDCATVFLDAPDERSARRVAALIRQPD